MAITLAQAQVNVQDDVDFGVIDDFRRYSWLLDRMVFDDVVNPTGGANLTYGYTRLIQPRTAQFRPYNTEYSPSQATRQRYTVDLKPHGGSFEIDRVLAGLGQQATNEVQFQLQQLMTATQHLVPAHMRASASACFLFINNLIGIGGGSWLLGGISDSLRQLIKLS